MSSEERELDGELVESFLRHLRGQGPRPDLDHLPPEDRAYHEEVFELLEAAADADAIEVPPFDEDRVAIRLGLVAGPPPTPSEAALSELVPAGIAGSLEDVVNRFHGEVEVMDLSARDRATLGSNGLKPLADCWSLGEVILVCSTKSEDLSTAPSASARMFAARSELTAVAIVSLASSLGVVLTQANCVRAIDPITGWVEPALPRTPEPLDLALARHLERTLPRWDEVAKLEEIVLFAEANDDLAPLADVELTAELRRPFKIPAKTRALADLKRLRPAALVAILLQARAGNLSGDELVERLAEVAEVEQA